MITRRYYAFAIGVIVVQTYRANSCHLLIILLTANRVVIKKTNLLSNLSLAHVVHVDSELGRAPLQSDPQAW